MKSFRSSWWLLLGLAFLTTDATCNKENPSSSPPPCQERAVFGDPAMSPYALPYPAGHAYVLSQSYCYAQGGHRNQLAYDFALPIGDTVTAARAGVVLEVREDLADTGSSVDPGAHNHVFVEHADGTVAFYAHLQQDGVAVQAGQTVALGQFIATSGNSGNTGNFPHLHFGVYQGWPAREGYDVAVNFYNAEGPLNAAGGLVKDEWYLALPEQ
ncbi:MAG: M23 family metallopeptidase [Lewinella sp.]|nr:M23 family metallopeptidase [Lewinella sp.]